MLHLLRRAAQATGNQGVPVGRLADAPGAPGMTPPPTRVPLLAERICRLTAASGSYSDCDPIR